MKRTPILATGVLLIAFLGGVAVQPEPQPAHPKALPADVTTIDGLMDAWYSAIAGEPGEAREWDRYKSLFVPKGQMVVVRPHEKGGLEIGTMTVDDFVEGNRRYMEQAGFVDTEISRTVDQFGGIAQVFSTYSSKRGAADPEPYARGINSLQLTYDGTRWWIVSVMWDQERQGSPIPAKYLVPSDK